MRSPENDACCLIKACRKYDLKRNEHIVLKSSHNYSMIIEASRSGLPGWISKLKPIDLDFQKAKT